MPTPTYTFVAGTPIDPVKVNANFLLFLQCMSAAGGDVTGPITPSTTNTIDSGSALKAWRSVFAYAFKLLDTDGSHTLNVVAGSNLTSNRTLTITTGDAARQLTISADSTINGVAYCAGGTDVALADGGTGSSLVDPNTDSILFWDDSAGAMTWLGLGTNLSITGTTLNATGGVTISGTANHLVKMSGTTGIQQSTNIVVDSSDNMTGVTNLQFSTTNSLGRTSKSADTVYQAASDGFIVVYLDGVSVGGSGSGVLKTDASNPPTTTVAGASVVNSSTTFCVPVKKGDFYKLTSSTTSGTVVFTLNWHGLGIGG